MDRASVAIETIIDIWRARRDVGFGRAGLLELLQAPPEHHRVDGGEDDDDDDEHSLIWRVKK